MLGLACVIGFILVNAALAPLIGRFYVVRTAYDGWLPAPYSHATREAEYKRMSAAEKCADRMNGYA